MRISGKGCTGGIGRCHQILDIAQNAFAAGNDLFADAGNDDGFVCTFYQADAQIGLQLLQRSAKSGLRYMAGLCCFAKVQVFADGAEIT